MHGQLQDRCALAFERSRPGQLREGAARCFAKPAGSARTAAARAVARNMARLHRLAITPIIRLPKQYCGSHRQVVRTGRASAGGCIFLTQVAASPDPMMNTSPRRHRDATNLRGPLLAAAAILGLLPATPAWSQPNPSPAEA